MRSMLPPRSQKAEHLWHRSSLFNEGSTPALGDAQVRRLLEAPPPDTLKRVFTRADSPFRKHLELHACSLCAVLLGQ